MARSCMHRSIASTGRIAGREEMTGTDVILAHRLLKSETPARLGLSRYVLLTDVAVARLDLDAQALLSTPWHWRRSTGPSA
jgi:hypothetical protein